MFRPIWPGKAKGEYRKDERRSRAKKSGKIPGQCGRLKT
jgi:hypothetical protein